MSNLCAVTGNILPTVSRASIRPCCYMDLGCRCQPAYISNISRASLKGILLIQRCKESIHCMSVFLLHLLHLFFCILIIFCCNSRYTAGIISLSECIRISIFFFCIFRNTKFFKILVENSLQCKVAYGICKTVYEFLFISSLCHQSSTLCDLIHTLLKLHCLCHMVGTDHIKNACTRLYHVRAASAGICDRIMDTCFITHVLTKELHSDIHKLNCIKSTASLLRCTGGM